MQSSISNAQILRVVQKLYRYKFLVLTEHVPANPQFAPNLDKAAGFGIRVPQGSGVVLTESPFLLKVKWQSVICAVIQSFGQYPALISTTLYELE